jgi:cytochrome c-type biogenesis protein CcmE
MAQNTLPKRAIRIGGYVKDHSIRYDKSGEKVTFTVTDKKNELSVEYQGILPNLFREGQTVVVTGKIAANHILLANQVLAKHDEKYIPKSQIKKVKKYDT